MAKSMLMKIERKRKMKTKRFLILTLFLSLILGFYSCKSFWPNLSKDVALRYLESYKSENIN